MKAEMINIRHRRQAQIQADVAFLEKAIEGAPLGDPSDEEMPEIYGGIKARRNLPCLVQRPIF